MIGKRLRKLRQMADLTQEELEKETGIPQETISAIETNRIKNPSTNIVIDLANFFQITLDELLLFNVPRRKHKRLRPLQ